MLLLSRFKIPVSGTSPVVQWLGIQLPLQAECIRSLVRELRLDMLCSTAGKKRDQFPRDHRVTKLVSGSTSVFSSLKWA